MMTRSTPSAFLCALALTLSSASAATEDLIVNKFDQASEASEWLKWWGGPAQTYEFDPAVDGDGNPSSGSLKTTIHFDRATYGGDNQFSNYKLFPAAINALEYTNLVFDLLWDPNSPRRPSGDFGYLEYGFRNSDFSQTYVGAFNVPTNAGWIRIVTPINPTLAKLDIAAGMHFKMWSGDANGMTGAAVFWVDNIKLVAITNGVEIVPPSLSMAKPVQGLNLIASQAGGQYQRQSIVTAQPNVSWINSFDPVNFSITISKFPEPAYSGFQAHMFLAPQATLPFGAGDHSPDWNAPHVIFFQIANNADGSAYARFMYKTNQPSGNGMFWNDNPASGPAGTLAVIGDASPLGTWTVSFYQDFETTVTVTTPSGSVTNFVFPDESAALFGDGGNNPIFAWFGAQPNTIAGIGQSAVFSRIRIQRDTFLYDDDFSAGLNSSSWGVAAANAPGVVAVPSDAAFWLYWTLPDAGFSLEGAAQVDNLAGWTGIPASSFQVLGSKRALIRSIDLLSPDMGFFRMVKPPTP